MEEKEWVVLTNVSTPNLSSKTHIRQKLVAQQDKKAEGIRR